MEGVSEMAYTAEYEVTSHDVDLNNHIEPSYLIRYLQETGNHQMRDRKPSYFELLDEGKTLVLIRISVEIEKQLHQYDRFTVRTWTCPPKRATLRRCWDVLRDGEVCARAYSEWALVDYRTKKLLTMGDVDFSHYESGKLIDMNIPLKFHFPKKMNFTEAGSAHIYYSDVDMNRHMNNTNYPNLVWRYIPGVEGKEVTSINIRFMKEAPLGSDLKITMTAADPEMGKDPRAEELFAFRTEINGQTNIEALIGVRKTNVLLENLIAADTAVRTDH